MLLGGTSQLHSPKSVIMKTKYKEKKILIERTEASCGKTWTLIVWVKTPDRIINPPKACELQHASKEVRLSSPGWGGGSSLTPWHHKDDFSFQTKEEAGGKKEKRWAGRKVDNTNSESCSQLRSFSFTTSSPEVEGATRTRSAGEDLLEAKAVVELQPWRCFLQKPERR